MAKGQYTTTPREVYVTQGDDWAFGLTLWDNGAIKDVSSATITAVLQEMDGRQAFAPVVQSSSSTGADWTNGVVVIEVPTATTTSVQSGQYMLEIEVLKSGKYTTWPLVPVFVQREAITH